MLSLVQQEKEYAAGQSARVIDAYRTLSKPLTRAIYVVSVTSYCHLWVFSQDDSSSSLSFLMQLLMHSVCVCVFLKLIDLENIFSKNDCLYCSQK